MIMVTTIFASSITLAQDNNATWNKHHGLYIDANAGTNLVYLGVISSEGNESNGGLYGFGYSIDIGYNFTPHIAAEVGFMQNYINLDETFGGDDEPNSNLREHSNIPYASMKFILPIGERASFFGKLGAMYANAKGEGIVLPYTGVGFSYAITKKIDVNVQYQGAVYGIAGAGLLSGGVSYHFS